jgi:hypothetical protein
MAATEARAALDARLEHLAGSMAEKSWEDMTDGRAARELREFLRAHASSLREFAVQVREEYVRQPTDPAFIEAADRANCGFETVEVEVYRPDPDRPGYSLHVRTKTVVEVFDEVRAIVGRPGEWGGWTSSLRGLDEYFSVGVSAPGQWPADSRIVVFSVRGGSEGDYVHVESIKPGGSVCLMLGKGFAGRAESWAAAKVLADLLGV